MNTPRTLHREPIIATCLHFPGKTLPHDSHCAGGDNKTAKYCADLAKASITSGEEKFGCEVIGFVSDENKMKKVRQLLQEWGPTLIVYGCSAHYLNLVENVATPPTIKNQLVEVQKYFRNHQSEAGKLKEAGGKIPQLPNDTRWTSERAFLTSFIENHPVYVTIRDEGTLPHNINQLLDNRLLLVEAKHMAFQLEKVSSALNVMQSDASDLGKATTAWLRLLSDKELTEEVRRAIKDRFEAVRSPVHSLAFLLTVSNGVQDNIQNMTSAADLDLREEVNMAD